MHVNFTKYGGQSVILNKLGCMDDAYVIKLYQKK